jgi:hypothetical protein
MTGFILSHVTLDGYTWLGELYSKRPSGSWEQQVSMHVLLMAGTKMDENTSHTQLHLKVQTVSLLLTIHWSNGTWPI